MKKACALSAPDAANAAQGPPATSGSPPPPPTEADAIAKRLGIPVEEFIKKYTRRVGDRLSLTERLRNKKYDCVFLEGKRCSIYEDRPTQCRTYPWWSENVENPESWLEEGIRCEGINHPDAPLISIGEIKKHLP